MSSNLRRAKKQEMPTARAGASGRMYGVVALFFEMQPTRWRCSADGHSSNVKKAAGESVSSDQTRRFPVEPKTGPPALAAASRARGWGGTTL